LIIPTLRIRTHFINDYYFNCTCLLGVRFFQQSWPKLIGMCRLQKRQPVVNGWKSVVDQHFHPFATPPQTKPENATVLLFTGKWLVGRHYAIKQTFTKVQHAQTRYEPFITCKTNIIKRPISSDHNCLIFKTSYYKQIVTL